MKSFELLKTDFQFNHLDESDEFKEYIEYVFEYGTTIYLVFIKDFKYKNPKSHIKEYYKKRGYLKVKFFKQ